MAKANATLTALPGVRVGHADDPAHRTGTTVVLLDPPAMAYADCRGGWPGSYDTAASDLGKTFIDRHALFLTGGDIFGYDAAIGIRRYLLEEGLAETQGGGKLPAIMGTNIYDLHFAPVDGRDYVSLGYAACRAASKAPVAQGTVGAGMGATVGPFFDARGLVGTKGGVGSSAGRVGPWSVGALVVTNCVGNVFDVAEGRTIAGTHRKGAHGFLEMDDVLDEFVSRTTTRSGTTVGVVGTDAPVDHEQLARLVELAHDGLALAIRPAHLSTDGDTILGFSPRRPATRRPDRRAFDALHHVAVREVARASVNAVRSAKGLGGVDGLADVR